MRQSPGVSRRALLQRAAALACAGTWPSVAGAQAVAATAPPSTPPHQGTVLAPFIPLVFNHMAVTRYDPRGGISPDVLVEETVEHFRAGHDEVLAQALKTLGAA